MDSRKRQRTDVVPTKRRRAPRRVSAPPPRFRRNQDLFGFHGSTPFSKEMYTKMRWSESTTVTPATGNVDWHTISLNSLYDPNVTGTGTQPQFFNTLCGNSGGSQPYRRYRVLGAKVTVRFVNNGASFAAFEDLVMVPSTAAVAPTTLEEAKEMGNAVYGFLGGVNDTPVKYLSTKVSMKNILGVKDMKDDYGTSGIYNGNPDRPVYLHIGAQPLDGTSSTTVYLNVVVDYFVQFFDRNVPADE